MEPTQTPTEPLPPPPPQEDPTPDMTLDELKADAAAADASNEPLPPSEDPVVAEESEEEAQVQLSDDKEEEEEDEEDSDDVAQDLPSNQHSPSSSPLVQPSIAYSVNEMEVITNRGGRAGSLSKFLDDADTFRRRSLQSYPEDGLYSLHNKKMNLSTFLDMQIDPILEVLEDTDSDLRLWLMQPETVKEVIQAFITPPVLEGEPHEEYGYYKNHFVCSEIIMKLYTGEEDLYESFSSDSSSGSTTTTAVFGCQEDVDIEKWEQLYSIFLLPVPLDEMQLLFFSKALVRLHDGFCLEEGYVSNVLRRFLPLVVPHLYSNTVKYMLTLILQSYESVHPITGRNDAMEIVAPLLAQNTKVSVGEPMNASLVENTSHLLVDMLQANQADRLGSFCRREGGVYLSKYFVRDQFGTIRGFESMTHGYHNFLQYMLLEELGKHPEIIDVIFENASHELAVTRENKTSESSSALAVHAATELLVLCSKHYVDGSSENGDNQDDESGTKVRGASFGSYTNSYADQYPGSPRESNSETAMYSLTTLSEGNSLWGHVLEVARSTAKNFVAHLGEGVPSSVEISVAKHLHTLVNLNDQALNEQLHEARLIPAYFNVMENRPTFDMLLIHIVPAIAFILRDADGTREKNCPLTKDLFGADDENDNTKTVVNLLLKAKTDIPQLQIYAAILHDVLDEVFANPSPSQNNAQVLFHCKRSTAWAQLTGKTKSPLQVLTKQVSNCSDENEEPRNSERRSSTQRTSSLRSSEHRASGRKSVKESPDFVEAADAAVNPADEDNASDRDSASSDKPNTPTNQKDNDRKSEGANAKPPRPPPSDEKDAGRKSTQYFRNVLQSPVFKSPMRLGSVIRIPEKTPPGQHQTSPSQQQGRGSFGWNNVFKKLRKSLMTDHSNKNEKKLLALSNEPYSQSLAPCQTDVFIVDTSRGEDITSFVSHDAGVDVKDVPVATHGSSSGGNSVNKTMNVVTSGYMYKNKLPETGQSHLWERYYFVLNRLDGSLSYYISEAHAKDRTFVRGTSRPVSVSEGIPVAVAGKHGVYGFQINTQGHGAFMVLVDSIDTRLVWLTEIHACVSLANPGPSSKRLSLLGTDSARNSLVLSGRNSLVWGKQEMKDLVVDYYKYLFGPNLKFSIPLEAPASFWMEEKIDPVAENCVLSSNLPDCVPYWGEFHGYKRLCDYWKMRDETIERSHGRVLRVVIDEDEETAVVMTSTTFRILRNSHSVTEESCDILSMSNGQIVSIHCTFDSFRVAEAFRKSPLALVSLASFVHCLGKPDLEPLARSLQTVASGGLFVFSHFAKDSMSELQVIVEHLNKEPFRLGLSLVAFDEKSNFELLQILNEVFTEIDAKHQVDLRNEADEQRAHRYLEFLQLLKFPLPRDVENFREALIHGDRQVLLPILHWALKSLQGHKKRAYLGRFLAPLNVPQEYFGNENLSNMHEHYKQLQDQFKLIHKEVDQLRNSKTRPGELRKEISQLEEEAHQLQEKIGNLKKKTASESGFKDILDATSALRKEQEEQAKLAERKRDQMMALALVEKRSRECEQRLMDLRASLSHDTPPDQLFEHLKVQVERNHDLLGVKFPQEFKLQQENLQRLERALNEPPKTENDIADMEDEIASLKSSIAHFHAQIAEAQKNAGDDKLAIFRQHASVQAKKLADKEDELDGMGAEKAKLQKQIEGLEAKISELSGSKFMSREEFKQYANTLRNKTNTYKKLKAELAEITAESVVLHRSEQLLKSKDADLDGFLKNLEAKKGVTGFLDTQEKLDQISEQNAHVNKMKGETLEEISRIVTDINQTLKERKNQLAPQIKELRAVRQKYQDMEQTYLERKAQYDNTAVGLETERLKLEQECHAFQEDCLREESQYHLLNCQLQIEQAKVDKIQQEMAFEQGQGRLLRDIKSFQELYKHKVAQQESLTKELRKQQKTLKSNTQEHNMQRQLFDNLFQLLQCKVKVANKAAHDPTRSGGVGGADLFDGHADIAQFDVGGANVMTLDA